MEPDVVEDESDSQHAGDPLQSDTIVHDKPPLETKEYIIALDQARRVGDAAPQHYGFEDMMRYALQVAEEVDVDSHEPSIYKETDPSSKSTQWLQCETR